MAVQPLPIYQALQVGMLAPFAQGFLKCARQHGDDAIICHNMQAYGHSYGDSQGNHDLNGYEAIQSVSRTIEGEAALLPENRLGIASIFAGLDDQTYEYLNSRRNALN